MELVVTAGYEVGTYIHMPATIATTFNQLSLHLERKVGPKAVRVYSSYCNSQSNCKHVLAAIGNAPIQSLMGPSLMLPISIHDLGPEITIRLVGMSNVSPLQKIHASDHISDLKLIIAQQVPLPPDQIELSNLLDSYDLTADMTIAEAGSFNRCSCPNATALHFTCSVRMFPQFNTSPALKDLAFYFNLLYRSCKLL